MLDFCARIILALRGPLRRRGAGLCPHPVGGPPTPEHCSGVLSRIKSGHWQPCVYFLKRNTSLPHHGAVRPDRSLPIVRQPAQDFVSCRCALSQTPRSGPNPDGGIRHLHFGNGKCQSPTRTTGATAGWRPRPSGQLPRVHAAFPASGSPASPPSMVVFSKLKLPLSKISVWVNFVWVGVSA